VCTKFVQIKALGLKLALPIQVSDLRAIMALLFNENDGLVFTAVHRI
jgi:hypothetical protein